MDAVTLERIDTVARDAPHFSVPSAIDRLYHLLDDIEDNDVQETAEYAMVLASYWTLVAYSRGYQAKPVHITNTMNGLGRRLLALAGVCRTMHAANDEDGPWAEAEKYGAALDIGCDYCDAAAGEWCVRSNGLARTRPHSPRRRASQLIHD